MKKEKPLHFHWVVASLVFLEMIIIGGLINSASVFIIPVCESFDISRSTFASANIPYNLLSMVGTLCTGLIFHRFGYQKPAIISLLLVGASMAVAGASQSVFSYSIARCLFGIGYGVCFTAGATFIIRNWFHRHQGLVLGAVSMASGLGGSLMTVLLTSVTDQFNWRIASYTAAALCVLMAVLYLILRDRPEEKGLRPFGFGLIEKKEKKSRTDATHFPGPTFAQLVKHPGFYLMILCFFLCCSCIYMASATAVPHFRSKGFSSGAAAAYQSALMLVLAAAKLVCGGLCDRFGAKSVSLVCVGCAALGELILGLSIDPVLCALGTALLAIGLCMTSILIPLLAQNLFGYRSAVAVNGIFLAMACAANILASILSGICFDSTGSYSPGYVAAAGGNLVVAGILLVVFRLTRQNRQSAE